MQLKIFQVDAFTSKLFGGNPAAVIPLEEWLEDAIMQKIALENNLSETAFFVKKENEYQLRWFTPVQEVRLCGHATLASAHVLYHHLGYKAPAIKFTTLSGPLIVERQGDLYTMNFPCDFPQTVRAPQVLKDALVSEDRTREYYVGTDDYLVVLPNQKELEKIDPDSRLLRQLDKRGVIITAPGEEVDFVSRCFYPKLNIIEDPVTGSAHTLLGPYWSNRLSQTELEALQLSQRVGHLHLKLMQARVKISGNAVTYMEGNIHF